MHWPGDSEGSFRCSNQAATCPPIYHALWGIHAIPLLLAERQAGYLSIPIFRVFDLTRPKIETESTFSAADGLSTRPVNGYPVSDSQLTGPASLISSQSKCHKHA